MSFDPVSSEAYFLVGPTAAGKTDVAQLIAETESYAILSADSMLVYRGMDIGTAKPGRAALEKVPTYGIDLVDPSEPFSAWDYWNSVRKVVCEESRPIIVAGGTGLYIKALSEGLTRKPGPDSELRQYWTARVAEEGLECLQKELADRYPAAYASVADKGNLRRLLRAMEVAAQQGDIAEAGSVAGAGGPCPRLTGLTISRNQLNSRIEMRVRAMYSGGLIDEVECLRKKYKRLSNTAMQAIGYREAMDYIDGKCSREEAMSRTIVRTRRLAKRQYTWFRHQAGVDWVEARPDALETVRLVMQSFAAHGPTTVSLPDDISGKA